MATPFAFKVKLTVVPLPFCTSTVRIPFKKPASVQVTSTPSPAPTTNSNLPSASVVAVAPPASTVAPATGEPRTDVTFPYRPVISGCVETLLKFPLPPPSSPSLLLQPNANSATNAKT